MASTTTDVIDGVTTSTAIKAPVRVATTANITLSGTQTIDGVAVVADDRVLVKNQTIASQNGVYLVSSTAWKRATDFDGNRDAKKGTIVLVNDGTTNQKSQWRVSTSDPITIGTSNISFENVQITAVGTAIEDATEKTTPVDADLFGILDSAASNALKKLTWANIKTVLSTTLQFLQAGTGAVSRSVQSKLRDDISASDFNAVGNGVANDATAINNALANSAGQPVYLLPGTYLVGSSISIPDGVRLCGAGIGKTIIKASAAINIVTLGNRSVLEDLTIDGNAQVSLAGVLIATKTYARVKGVRVINTSTHGFALTTSTHCRLDDIEAEGCGSRGVLMDPACAYNHIFGLHAKNNTNGGLLIGHGSFRNLVDGFTIEGSGNAQLWLHHEAYLNIVKNGTIRAPSTAAVPGFLLALNAYQNILSHITVEGHNEGGLLRAGPVDAGYVNGNTRQNILSHLTLIGPGTGVANSMGIKFDSTNAGSTKNSENILSDILITNFENGIRDSTSDSLTDNNFSNINAATSVTNKFVAASGHGSHMLDFKGYTPQGHLSSPPAVAASGSSVSNPYPFSVMVVLNAMPADGNVQINGVAVTAAASITGGGNGMWLLSPDQTITLIYPSGTPTWRWFGLV